MQQIRFTCPIISIAPLNQGGAFDLVVRAPEIAQRALPGQFVHVSCGHRRLLRRPISICAVEGENLRLVFEVRGAGTEWLSRRTTDRKLDLLGSLGRGFTLPEEPDRPILMVGGGLGVPPLLMCAQNHPSSHAVLGFRSQHHAMLVPDFDAACRSLTLTSDDGTLGQKGTVEPAVREKLAGGGFSAVLACGPRPMLRAVARVAEEYSVPCQVSLEERMGCGVGACLVCACKVRHGEGERYAHVCKDGPVFDAQEVMWDE